MIILLINRLYLYYLCFSFHDEVPAQRQQQLLYTKHLTYYTLQHGYGRLKMIHLYGIKREANYFMGIYHLSEFKDNIEFLCKKGLSCRW